MALKEAWKQIKKEAGRTTTRAKRIAKVKAGRYGQEVYKELSPEKQKLVDKAAGFKKEYLDDPLKRVKGEYNKPAKKKRKSKKSETHHLRNMGIGAAGIAGGAGLYALGKKDNDKEDTVAQIRRKQANGEALTVNERKLLRLMED